ncbi:hypothetical protein ACIO53_19530 [Streptomyces sp. NPDC087305]|uniref:hypothetical protein n=1 Tax=Streptomyces sp. NPDC087305 TaxID=3365781 RepID=UPI0038117142
MTTTTKAERAEDTEEIAPPLPRGRHRRPRPRKILLAVGGLAVAAGVLSLVRLAPESGVGGLGTAEAEPSPDATRSADRPANAAATIRADPSAIPSTIPTTIPSATSVMGGESATPTTTSGVVPTPYATTTHTPAEVHPPAVPETPAAATPPPEAPAPHPTSSTAPDPTPTPSRPANSPSPAPSRPRLCVPIIGLCVDGLANHRVP